MSASISCLPGVAVQGVTAMLAYMKPTPACCLPGVIGCNRLLLKIYFQIGALKELPFLTHRADLGAEAARVPEGLVEAAALLKAALLVHDGKPAVFIAG